MGYTTEFTGQIAISPPLNPTEIAYLNKFSETRRMERGNGPYFVEGTGFAGQGRDGDVIDFNRPPEEQPGLWCQWVPTEDGAALEWNQGEKFYCAPEWMTYLINHFLKPGAWTAPLPEFATFTFDHTLDGVINAQGEEPDDAWQLVVMNNIVHTRRFDEEIPDVQGDMLARIDEVLHDSSVSMDAMRSRPVA